MTGWLGGQRSDARKQFFHAAAAALPYRIDATTLQMLLALTSWWQTEECTHIHSHESIDFVCRVRADGPARRNPPPLASVLATRSVTCSGRQARYSRRTARLAFESMFAMYHDGRAQRFVIA
jgi:hypothetical protein